MSQENLSEYVAEIVTWRTQREAELRAPDSWLSLVGLFVLSEGLHTIGSSASNAIVLPPSAPDYLGVIEFLHNKASLTITTDTPVLIDGVRGRRATLADNGNRQKPTLVTSGSVTFFVHHFGDQYAIRVKDSTSPSIATFPGLDWFTVKAEYRVEGKFVPYNTPRAIPIKTIVDTNSEYKSVGAIEFELQGQPLSLLAQDFGLDHQHFIAFRDATSGQQTYGPARFLAVDVADDGRAVIDFNKAYNPPCAFSPYATCPLPPRENILSVPIEAGERYTPIQAAVREAPALGGQVA